MGIYVESGWQYGGVELTEVTVVMRVKLYYSKVECFFFFLDSSFSSSFILSSQCCAYDGIEKR